MKKIIFLLIVVLLIGYAWFGLYKNEIHSFFARVEKNADEYISSFKKGSDKVDEAFNEAGDKYLDGFVGSINEQVKQKIVEWLIANNKMSTTTAVRLTEGADGYKKILEDNPKLMEYIKTLK